MERRMWHVWQGQWWPTLPEQEREFVFQLREAVKSPSKKFDRDDVTALMNVFRCGTSFEQLLEAAPGAKLERILAAYEHLESRRLQSVQAWRNIEEEPIQSTLLRNADLASLLLPLPVHKMLASIDLSTHDGITRSAAEFSAMVSKMHVLARGIERELTLLTPQDNKGIELGTKLHAAHNPGIYADQFFLADRVSSLSSIRINSLLSKDK